MGSTNDGSESVDDFLARIAGLSGGRDDAEEQRKRRAEEELLRAKKERQARRAERARSLSPSKTGPLPSLTSSLDPALSPSKVVNPPVDFSPRASTLSRSNAVKLSPTLGATHISPPPSPSFSQPEPTETKLKSGSDLARGGTLSWQQRPTSRDGSPTRSRPLSGFASIRVKPRDPSPETKAEPSRNEIAASLSSKDPSWFKQTQDRGASSAAYRKNQVEDLSAPSEARSMQLPGMAKQSPRLSRSATPEIASQTEEARPDVRRDPEEDRFRRGDTPDMLALRKSMVSPPSVKHTRSDLPASDAFSLGKNDALGTPTKSAATLGNRPVSPTKGLGGFVESAMMRRSDSVSKRWSVQAGAGLKRGDSTASPRPTGVIGSIHSRERSVDTSVRGSGLASSPLGSSRPVSSLDSAQNTTETSDSLRTSIIDKPSDLILRMPAPRADTVAQEPDPRPTTPQASEALPEVASKTTDPRRWSPTKSTWLESALQTKSEPVKLQPMKEDTPKWKVDLQRSKSRAGRDDSPKRGTDSPAIIGVDRPLSTPSLKSEKPGIAPKPALFAVESNTDPGSGSRSMKDSDGSEEKKQEKPPPEQLEQRTPKSEPEIETDSAQVRKAEPVSRPDSGRALDKDVSAANVKAVKSPPPLKAKPQTPPKTDFRATLKSRATDRTQENNAEPEFKAVFGKLKRTTTQNYVAPDELKNNILSGKAALNVTDGPQKTEVVDEFKKSILNKKEQMKTSTRQPTKIQDNQESQQPVPEALARRKTLSKASGPPSTVSLHPKPPAPAAKPQSISSTSATKADTSPAVASVPSRQVKDASAGVSKPVELKEPITSTAEVTRSVSPSSANNPPVQPALRPTVKSAQPMSTFNEAPSGPAGSSISAKGNNPSGGLPANSKLASRLNPNLAALITRAGSPRPQTVQGSPDDDYSSNAHPVAHERPEDDSTPGSLNHMTKGRAKGPKRRAPKADKTTTSAKGSSKNAEAPQTASKDQLGDVVKPITTPTPRVATVAVAAVKTQAPRPVLPKQPLRPLAQTKVPPLESPPLKNVAKPTDSQPVSPEPEMKAKPVIAAKASDLRRVSAGRSAPTEATPQATTSPKQKPAVSPTPKPSFSPKPFGTGPTPFPQTLPSSDPWGKEGATPGKSSTREDTPPSIRKSSKGLGVNLKPERPSQKPTSARLEMTPPAEKDSLKKVTRDSKVVSSTLVKYFGSLPRMQGKFEFDTQALLKLNSEPSPKYKTKQHTIFELTGDGKKVPMPAGQEHILYEESMYLVTHIFENDAEAATAEVYLWCGDQTSEAAVQDVQIFCRKDAREHSAKLTIVKQGKEPQNFFQALGGIVIVRRSKSSAFYMLRGRRHIGHVAFDEVNFEAADLCPGFAYLISAQFGKLYLWKGKGAGPDEVGAARLLGMDLGLTGEIEEVEEGSEPKTFWNSFSNKTPGQWSDDWTERTKHDGYPCSLLRVEHEQAKAGFWGLGRAASPDKSRAKALVTNISPYSQQDIEEAQIHVLDAYRSIYVLVNKDSTKREGEFVTAVQLAQDVAMLSPSIQDRALLPSCYVVFGEPGPDVRACFRKWTPRTKEGNDSLCVRLEEVMEVLDL